MTTVSPSAGLLNDLRELDLTLLGLGEALKVWEQQLKPHERVQQRDDKQLIIGMLLRLSEQYVRDKKPERWQLLTLCEQLKLYDQLDRQARLDLLAAQIDEEVTA